MRRAWIIGGALGCLAFLTGLGVLAQEGLVADAPDPTSSELVLNLDLSQPLVRDGVALTLEGVATPGVGGEVSYQEAVDAIHAKVSALLGLADTPDALDALGAVLRITDEETLQSGALVLTARLDLADAASLAAAYGAGPASPVTPEGSPADPAGTPEMPVGESTTTPTEQPGTPGQILAEVRDDPDNPALYNQLGLAYAATGDTQEALPAFHRSAELYGPDAAGAEPRANIAAIYFMQGRHGDALKQYRLALQLDANYGLARYGSAACYEALGDTGQARAEYTAYLMLAPDGPLAQAARDAIARLGDGGGGATTPATGNP